jgi:hypothetical protein
MSLDWTRPLPREPIRPFLVQSDLSATPSELQRPA